MFKSTRAGSVLLRRAISLATYERRAEDLGQEVLQRL